MKILYTFLLLLVVSSTAYCQTDPDDCPKVEPGADWLNPANNWIYQTDSNDPSKTCRTDITYTPLGYARSQCTAWANYRTGFRGIGNGGQWANDLPICETATGNNDNCDCWSYTPSAGTLMITVAEPGETGHVAVVECVDKGSAPSWIKVSEFNYTPCEFTYRTVTDIKTKPYKYIYPKGKTLSLSTNCSAPPEIPTAYLTPLNTNASEVNIPVKMRGAACKGIYYSLIRSVKLGGEPDEERNKEYDDTIQITNVNETYLDHLINLTPCSQISYVLLKAEEKFIDNNNLILYSKSEPRLAYNLTTPKGFTGGVREGTKAMVDLNWEPTCKANGNSYEIAYMCGRPDGSFIEKTWGTGRSIQLLASTQYKCCIRAYNDGDVSLWSDTISFITQGDPAKIPVPASPQITPLTPCNPKTLSWNSIDPDQSNGDDFFYEVKVYRNGKLLYTYPLVTRPSNTLKISSTSANPSFSQIIPDYTLPFRAIIDGEYGFSVKAISKDRTRSSEESTQSLTTINCLLEVPVIANTIATGACQGATLTWGFQPEVSPINIYKFLILRANSPESKFDSLAEVGPTVTSYTDFTIENNSKAYYKVVAKYADLGNSEPSAYKEVLAKSPPQTPIQLKATSSDKVIAISFVDNADDESGFILERSPNNQFNYATIKTFPTSVGKGKTLTHTDLAPASNIVYYYRVKAVMGTCSTHVATAAYTHTVVMLTPDNLKATFLENEEPSKSRIKLTWRGLSRSANRYEIYRKRSIYAYWPDEPSAILEVSPGDGQFSWQDKDLGEHLYQYKVRARYDLGEAVSVSAFVGPVAYTVTDKCAVGERPITPTITLATADSTTALLKWTDNSTNENGFFLEYSTDNKTWNLFKNIRSYTATTSNTVGNPFRQELDLSNYLSGQVFLRVRAYKDNADGSKCFSAIPVGTPTVVYILRAPASIKVSQYTTAKTFKVDWTNNTFYESSYEVQFRSSLPQSASWTSLVQTIPDAVSYLHQTITVDADYYYRVRAITKRGGVIVAQSTWTTLTTPVRLFIPAKPSTFQVESVDPLLPYGQYKYTWTDNATNEDNHTVTIWVAHPTTDVYGFLKRTSFASTAVDKSGTGRRSSPNTPALAVGKYRFGLHAYNSIGNSDTVYTTFTVYGVPDAPTLLTSTVECSPMGDRVKLNWQDNAKNAKTETGFKVYRALASTGPFAEIGSTDANVTTFTDKGTLEAPLIAGKTYFYIVKGYSEFVKKESLSSNAASAKFPIKQLPVVTNVTTTSTVCASLTIKWTPVAGVDGYRIRVTCNNETYVPYTTPTAVSSYTFTTTKTGYHSVTVEARSACNNGPESIPVTTWVNSSIPLPPTSVSITGGCGIASGSWLPVANTNYRIDAVLNGKVVQYILKNVAPIQPTFSMSNLLPGNYTFNVYASNCKGTSAATSIPVRVLGLPTTPVQLKIVAQCNNVSLNWPPVMYAEYYTIYRKQGTDPVYTTLGKVYCNSIENIVSGPLNTPYTYAVEAGNSCGISPKSTPISTFITCTNSAAKATSSAEETDNKEDVLLVHPNPFTNSATLTYTVNSPGVVHLTIYNQLGLPLFTLVDNEYKAAGTYEALIDEKYLANGLYVCVYKVGNKFYTTKLIKH